MKTPDLLELAARNLRESMLRNSLTTLGIGVGVASLVAMLSLGVGLQQFATRRLERTGLFDTVIVSRRDFGGFAARRRPADATSDNRVLDEDARREISGLARGAGSRARPAHDDASALGRQNASRHGGRPPHLGARPRSF